MALDENAFIPGLLDPAPLPGQEAECRSFHGQNLTVGETCAYVQNTTDCSIQSGYVDYTVALYCTFGSFLPFGLFLLFLWWLMLVMGMAVAADNFFCPSLVVIARAMRMSDNIAGVTLVALGNGAPDVFSAIAAIRNAKDGDIGMAIGALLGAGIFVTTVVAGAVCFTRPFQIMQRPFLRDVIFYIFAVYLTFYILWDGHITLAESIGYLVLYVFYVLMVVLGRLIYQRHKRRTQEQEATCTADNPSLQDEEEEHNPILDREQPIAPREYGSFLQTPQADSGVRELSPADDESDQQSVISSQADEGWRSGVMLFLSAINPLPLHEWKERRWYGKLYMIIKAPVVFGLLVTVPVVDPEQPLDNWQRELQLFHCVFSPSIALFLASPTVALHMLGGHFPVVAVLFLLSCALAVLVFFTSTRHQAPKYHLVFAFVGFIIAVIWISVVANEVVNILATFGINFNLSNAVLGLGLLAWGNSIADLIADTAMARNGLPRAGISACFGGPLFNLLVGIGLPFTLGTAQDGNYHINFTPIQVVLVAGLLFSLVSSLVLIPAQKFFIGRAFGIYLFSIYAVFLVVALLVETGVITIPGFDG